MSMKLLFQDIILYLVVLAGIGLYATTLARKLHSNQGHCANTQYRYVRKLSVFIIAISLLFVVGVLHQTSILVGAVSWVAIVIAAVLSFFALLWIRRMPNSIKE